MEESQLKPLAVSPNTASKLLDCSRGMIYAQMSAGNLKFITVGSDRRIPMAEIRRAAKRGLPKLLSKKPTEAAA